VTFVGFNLAEYPTWPSYGDRLPERRNRGIGGANGEATPLNTKIVEMVHQVERTGQFLSVEEILQAFGR
jgi:hypothetical protein